VVSPLNRARTQDSRLRTFRKVFIAGLRGLLSGVGRVE
jgi:hypothetical protein